MRWGEVRLCSGLSAGVVRGGARAWWGGAGTRKSKTVVKLHYTLLWAGGRGYSRGRGWIQWAESEKGEAGQDLVLRVGVWLGCTYRQNTHI